MNGRTRPRARPVCDRQRRFLSAGSCLHGNVFLSAHHSSGSTFGGEKRCRNLSRDEHFAVCKKLAYLLPSNANLICVHQGVEMSRLKMNGSIFLEKLTETFVMRQEHKGKECDMVTTFHVIQNTIVMTIKKVYVKVLCV